MRLLRRKPGEEVATPAAARAAGEGVFDDARERAQSSHATGPSRGRGGHESWNLDEGAPIADGRTVLRSLGGGRRFEVFLVWDDRLFSIVVAKVLRPDRSRDERSLRELAREADLLERLSHPILVRGFGAVLDGEHPHLLLEHLEGPTLRSLVRKGGPLPLQQLLPLALNVAAALHYLSTEEVVHLDVKPGNIVVGVPPRLIDLSLARSLDRAARLTGSVGTDPYMPPEQCGVERWQGRIGPAADVFGLGATLYYAATGRLPFPRAKGARQHPDPVVRFPQLVDEPSPLPSQVPTALRELIVSALARDPDDRPTSTELAQGLEPLVAGLPRRPAFGRRRARQRSS